MKQISAKPRREWLHGLPTLGRLEQGPVKWVLLLFLIGTVLDYGGQLYIKRLVYILMIIYTVTNPRARTLLKCCLPDLMILLIIPFAILLIHLVFDPGEGMAQAGGGLWLCMGSPGYFLCLPLFLLVGVERVAKWLIIIFVIHSIISTLLTIFHAMGVVNLLEHSDFMTSHGLGIFSSDSRASDFGGEMIALPRLGGYQSYPLVFILALALSPVSAIFLALAVLVTTERGLAIGLIMGFGAMFKPLRDKWLKVRHYNANRLKRIFLSSIKITLLGIFLLFILSYLDQIVSLFIFKFKIIGNINDPSGLIRLEHINGYLEKLYAHPLGFLWGFGPLAGIYNKALGETVQMTELVIIMYMLWYGFIYTIVFYGWVIYAILRLFYRSNTLFDRALAISCGVMVIIGNINPIMQMPIAFILFAMIRARTIELEVGHDFSR